MKEFFFFGVKNSGAEIPSQSTFNIYVATWALTTTTATTTYRSCKTAKTISPKPIATIDFQFGNTSNKTYNKNAANFSGICKKERQQTKNGLKGRNCC